MSLPQKKTGTYNFNGIRYGMWTIGVYALIFLLIFEFRPSLRAFLNQGSGPIIWYIVLRLLPFIVAFVFLITGYSAIKGDKTQIFPAIIHGIALVALLTNLFQAMAIGGFQ